MSYRNKTYVIFDAEKDLWAFNEMKAWPEREGIAFSFLEALDLSPLSERAPEETVKARLKAHLGRTKQAVALIGEGTRRLTTFVRLQLDICTEFDIPVVAANLAGGREMDPDRCPDLLKRRYVLHVPLNAKVIQYALDNFPYEYRRRKPNETGERRYDKKTYRRLGL